MIEMLILDVDGTLYPLESVAVKNFNNGVRFLSQRLSLPIEDVRKQMIDYGIKPYASSDNKSITAFVLSKNISREQWNAYRNSNFDISHIALKDCVAATTIKNLSRIYKTAILSSNSITNVRKVLRHIQIEESIFSDVICIDTSINSHFNKETEMRQLAQKYSVRFHNLLSVGDRYQTDILPALKLGGMGALISRPCDLDWLYNDLTSGHELSDGNHYKFFQFTEKEK